MGRKAAGKSREAPESRKYPALVRVSEDVAQLARELAPLKKMSQAELLTETLRPALGKMLEDEMRRRLKG